VGLVASKYIYGGCRILSAPHRHPIGEVTSCAWSPLLQRRVCQALIKPEFAVSDNPVLVTVPQEVPESIDARFKRRITKQGSLQNVFRKLVPARVVSFPLTSAALDLDWSPEDLEIP
jgi:glycine cleavage system aminomethyltransferase T